MIYNTIPGVLPLLYHRGNTSIFVLRDESTMFSTSKWEFTYTTKMKDYLTNPGIFHDNK